MKRCLLLFTLVFEHCKQRKFLSSLPYNIFCFFKGKIPCGAGKLLLLPRSGGHPCEWAWLYGTFCASSFSWQHRLEHAVTAQLAQWPSEGHSFCLDGDYPSALCSMDTSETGRQRQHTKTMYLVCSTVCMSEWLRENITPDQESRKSKTNQKKKNTPKLNKCSVRSPRNRLEHCVTKELFASSIKHSFCGFFCVYCSEYIDWQECSWEQWILCKY